MSVCGEVSERCDSGKDLSGQIKKSNKNVNKRSVAMKTTATLTQSTWSAKTEAQNEPQIEHLQNW